MYTEIGVCDEPGVGYALIRSITAREESIG
jgi:hypothetical protein